MTIYRYGKDLKLQQEVHLKKKKMSGKVLLGPKGYKLGLA